MQKRTDRKKADTAVSRVKYNYKVIVLKTAGFHLQYSNDFI